MQPPSNKVNKNNNSKDIVVILAVISVMQTEITARSKGSAPCHDHHHHQIINCDPSITGPCKPVHAHVIDRRLPHNISILGGRRTVGPVSTKALQQQQLLSGKNFYKYRQWSAAEPLVVLTSHCSCFTECVACDAAVGVLEEIKVKRRTEESSCAAVGASQPIAEGQPFVKSNGHHLTGPPADLCPLLIYVPVREKFLWLLDHLGQRNMPHIKTFCKTNISILKFCMVTCEDLIDALRLACFLQM